MGNKFQMNDKKGELKNASTIITWILISMLFNIWVTEWIKRDVCKL